MEEIFSTAKWMVLLMLLSIENEHVIDVTSNSYIVRQGRTFHSSEFNLIFFFFGNVEKILIGYFNLLEGRRKEIGVVLVFYLLKPPW